MNNKKNKNNSILVCFSKVSNSKKDNSNTNMFNKKKKQINSILSKEVIVRTHKLVILIVLTISKGKQQYTIKQ